MSIKLLDPKDATFELALEFSKVFYDAFQKDPLTQLLWGPRFSVPTPPPAGSVRDHQKACNYLAYSNWTRIRDPNNRVFLMYEGEKLVGLSMWYLPGRMHKRLPLLHRLKNLFITALKNIVGFWYFFGRKDAPPPIGGFHAAFAETENRVGYTKLQVPETEMAHMSRDELSKARYSAAEYSWCQLCAVSSSCHGKGYGKKLFQYAMEHIPKLEPVFKDGDVQSQGPAKLALFATEAGRPLYEKLGWRVIDEPTTVFRGEVALTVPLLVYVCE